MELILFTFLLAISFLLIVVGLFRPEHTEMAIIGFVFLFILSFNFIGYDIQHQTGEFTNNTFVNETADFPVLLSSETHYIYGDVDFGGTISHTTGYWLAIMSIVGFIGVLVGLRKQRLGGY